MKVGEAIVESKVLEEFAGLLPELAQDMASRPSGRQPTGLSPSRLNLEPENAARGLMQLVLTLVKLLHELLERQSLRRLEAGSLSEDEIERLGVTLKRQAQEIDRLRQEFGLEEDGLNLDLGPLGRLL